MKKTNLIRCFKILALALPILLFVLISQHYLFYYSDHNTERIRRFYQEEKNSLDVVFMGASDVYSGFAPALAYEECGFTSYCYAIDANSSGLFPYQLKEVISHQQPQVIFVEINSFMYDSPVDQERLQVFAENIPFSSNKLEVILQHKEENKIGALLPFVTYHGDWEKGGGLIDQLKWRISTSRNPSLLKGVITCTMIDETPLEEVTIPEAQKATMRMAEKDLDEFLAFCQQEGLDNVVFVRFPHKDAAEQEVVVSQVADYVQQRGYQFLNLENHQDTMGLEPTRDYYNSEHLNVYGQRKLTSYLGNLILNDFHVTPAAQTEENSHHWDTCVSYYHGFYDYANEKIKAGIEEWPCEDNLTFGKIQEWMKLRNAA